MRSIILAAAFAMISPLVIAADEAEEEKNPAFLQSEDTFIEKMRKIVVLSLILVFSLLVAACGGTQESGGKFRVAVVMPSAINDLAFSHCVPEHPMVHPYQARIARHLAEPLRSPPGPLPN